MPTLFNMVGDPYTDSDAAWYLQMIRDGGFDPVKPTAKPSTGLGIKVRGSASPLIQQAQENLVKRANINAVLKLKADLSKSIKNSYDEHARTGGTQDALYELGRFVAFKTGGIFMPGPLKGWDGVIRKTMDFSEGGYKGNYAQMKDEVRITIVGEVAQIYADICQYMRGFCRPLNKMLLIKDKTRNPDTDDCGYSDTNFVVRLPNGKPGEVQVNNKAVLYGKMAEATFCRDLGVGKFEYLKLRMKYGVEGGLGHGFYEIFGRVSKGNDNGKLAADLSKRYYKVLRSYPNIDFKDRANLVDEIKKFKKVPVNRHTFAH